MSLGGGGEGRQQLEELSQQIQEIEDEKEQLQATVEGIREEQQEIDEAVEGLETLESGSNVQVPLGGGAYLKAEITDIDEVVVELGGGYAAERDQEGAVESLQHRKDVLDDRIEEVQEEIEELDERSDELEEEAQQLQQQLLQQMQQQQGGGPGQGGPGQGGDPDA